jgi:hypothetical protein
VAGDFQGLIHTFKSEFSQISVDLSPKYASRAPDFRSLLRMSIYQKLQEPSLLDLTQIPRLPHGFVSISHCPSLGGYVLSKNPVGFDIEESSRVEWRFVDRMSHPDDEKGPTAAAQWCAKEAVFKLLADQQPPVLSQIAIYNWKSKDHNIYTFESNCGAGGVIDFAPWTTAVSF